MKAWQAITRAAVVTNMHHAVNKNTKRHELRSSQCKLHVHPLCGTSQDMAVSWGIMPSFKHSWKNNTAIQTQALPISVTYKGIQGMVCCRACPFEQRHALLALTAPAVQLFLATVLHSPTTEGHAAPNCVEVTLEQVVNGMR